MDWNYDSIKLLSKRTRQQSGKSNVSDFLVLAQQNDPFYCGTETDKVNGGWFADIWNGFKIVGNVHLRRFHYRIISQEEPVLMPNGKPFENTEACWQYLGVASKSARYLDLVDPTRFDDRRADEPRIFYEPKGNQMFAEVDYDLDDGIDFKLPNFPDCPSFWVRIQVDQPYQIEIWAEKSTMNDVIVPLCENYKVNYVAGVGEMSISQTVKLVDRIIKNRKPTRILYVSDFDPAGQSMPVAVARKIEWQARKMGLDDIVLEPVVLTFAQCNEYQLPRTPLKESERRAGKFESRFGAGATELDALEALYPGELHRILEEHILRFYDDDLAKRTEEAEGEIDAYLQDTADDIIGDRAAELEELEDQYDALKSEFENSVEPIKKRTAALINEIKSDLENNVPYLDDDWFPEIQAADDYGKPLYSSSRDYLEQLAVYKQFQGKSLRGLSDDQQADDYADD